MYDTHQPAIQAYAQESSLHFKNVLDFVQCTINQRFYNVGHILDALHHKGHSKYLTRRQQDALDFYAIYHEEIYESLYACTSDFQRMLVCVQLPGFGIAKSGFIVQLCFGTVGCMDTHNIKMYGLNPKLLRHTTSTTVVSKRIQTYLTIGKKIGSATLWNQWCTLIAHKYPRYFASPEDVSAKHLQLCKPRGEYK